MHEMLLWIQTHQTLTWELVLAVNALLAAFVILLENREPERSIAWFLVLFTFPLIGFIFYLFFGHDWHRRRYRKERMHRALTTEFRETSYTHLITDPTERALRTLAANATGIAPTFGNTVNILTDGAELYEEIFRALRAARTSIDVEYYIFRNDTIGKKFIQILKERASAGVRVRFMIDGMGSFGFGHQRFRDMRAAGIRAHYFSPLITLLYFFKANYRDHRKIVLVDDTVAFVGGANISTDALHATRSKRFRDTSATLRGPAVRELARVFEENWTRTTGESSRTIPECSALMGDDVVSVVPSGPDSVWHSMNYLYAALIHAATHSVRIQTPYFVPDESILAAITTAALRGVRVELMLPQRLPRSEGYLRWVAHTYLEDLLRAGAHAYEYTNGFLHSKVVMIDHTIASMGSCNVDVRSIRLDFEASLLLSGVPVAQLNANFDKDLRHCVELNYAAFVRRPKSQRIKESLARLISPLL
jgi:cardiolipin synthase A/B